jgi:hypothetical protein
MRHLLKVQGHILLEIRMQQLQDDAPPRLALTQLAQIALQQCTDQRDHQTYTPPWCLLPSCQKELDFIFDICAWLV